MHHKKQTTAAIHRKIAYVIQRYIEDPRLKNIVVTAVKLSKKLDYADVSVTQLNSRFTEAETLAGFKKAAAKIRYYLAKEFDRARAIPRLRFHYDTFLAKSIQLHQVIHHLPDSLPT